MKSVDQLIQATLIEGGLDPVTAFFSGAVGGASEMAVQAERQLARVELVAAVHSLRVLIVVVLLPFAYRWLGLHGQDLTVLSPVAVDLAGLIRLSLLAVIGGLIMHRLRAPKCLDAWPAADYGTINGK